MAGIFHSTDPAAMETMAARFEGAGLTVTTVEIGGVRVGHARADGALDDYVAVDEHGCGIVSSSRIGYQGHVGREALAAMYDDHLTGGVDRRTLVNDGVSVIASDREGYEILTGVSGVPVLYWHAQGPTLTWASVLYFMASTVPDLTLDPAAVVERALNYSLVGSDTIFNEIDILTSGAAALVRHTGNGPLWTRRPADPLTPRSDVDGNEAAATIVKVATDQYRTLGCLYDGFTVYMTGGLDSRLQLALLLAADVDRDSIDLVYGVGNSFMTNTKQRDLEIVRQIASGERLRFAELDWTADGFDESGWDGILELSGEEGLTYARGMPLGSQRLTTAEVGQFVVFGYFGELLRPLDWQTAAMDGTMTLRGFVDRYLQFPTQGVNPAVLDEMRTRITGRFAQVLDRGPDERLTEPDVLRAYIEYRRSADTRASRLRALRGASFPVLGHPEILEVLLGLSFEAKAGSRLLVDVTRRCAPELLSYQVFSHARTYELSQDGSLQRPRKTLASSGVKDGLRAALPAGSRRGRLARDVYRGLRPGKTVAARPARLVEAVEGAQTRSGVAVLDPDVYQGDARGLIHVAQQIRLFELSVR